jgi:hypothetical protein
MGKPETQTHPVIECGTLMHLQSSKCPVQINQRVTEVAICQQRTTDSKQQVSYTKPGICPQKTRTWPKSVEISLLRRYVARQISAKNKPTLFLRETRTFP